MKIKSNEFIILRLRSTEYNIAFLYHTFGISQYVFFDKRFLTSKLVNEDPEKFNLNRYNRFREKCLLIKEKQLSITINEFIYLAKVIDFVSKCYVGEPREKFEKIFSEDFNGEEFNFDQLKDWYLETATVFFEGFRENCKNEKLLRQIEDQLNWSV